MSEATTLSAILHSIDEGPAWHGPATQELLRSITPEQAAAIPEVGVHSIWELVMHMTIWLRYTVDVLSDTSPEVPGTDEDWPRVPEATHEEWERTRREFHGAIQELRELIVHCDDDRLREHIPGRNLALKVLLHGVIHHTIYHTGQIGLLSRAPAEVAMDSGNPWEVAS